MISQAKRKSNNKWDRANMAVLCCKVRRGYAERLRAVIADNGDTINAVIRRALDEYLREHEGAGEG